MKAHISALEKEMKRNTEKMKMESRGELQGGDLEGFELFLGEFSVNF